MPNENVLKRPCFNRVSFLYRKIVDMGLFLDAALSWNNLCDTRYILDVAKRGKLIRIEISFLNEDFPHLAGMHYATDVDFGINKSEYYGERLIPSVLNKYLDDTKIELSRNWSKISGRLSAITNLQKILDSEFIIVSFDSAKVRCYCQIDAKFAIKSTTSNDVFFIFLDRDSGRYYCKSAFKEESIDYSENQSKMAILQKVKITNGISNILFTKQGYHSNVEVRCI